MIDKILTVDFWHGWWTNHAEVAIAAAAKIAVIIIAYVIMRFIAFRVVRRAISLPISRLSNGMLEARKARLQTLQSVTMSAVGFVLVFVLVVMVLQAAGIDIVPLITAAGVAGLAIGFGAQKLVKDIIAGFFILMEDQYGVGDLVTIGMATGTVEELGLRTTRVRDATGKLFIISNGDITQVWNASRGDMRVSVDITLAPSTDFDKAISVLNKIGADIASDYPNKVSGEFICNGIAQISAAGAVYRLTGSAPARYQSEVVYDLNQRIRRAVAENELELAKAE